MLGLHILTGYNGQISLGHGAFFAIGAYITAILMYAVRLCPIWATLPFSAIVCAAVGFLIGLPALRLGGLYLALTTFALAVAVPQILKHKYWRTGPAACRASSWTSRMRRPAWRSHPTSGCICSRCHRRVAVPARRNLMRGRIGRALMAIRDHPMAAEAMGIDIAR